MSEPKVHSIRLPPKIYGSGKGGGLWWSRNSTGSLDWRSSIPDIGWGQ